MLCQMPDNDSCGCAYVERMFCSELWKLDATVAGINHFLMHTLDFIAEDEGEFRGER